MVENCNLLLGSLRSTNTYVFLLTSKKSNKAQRDFIIKRTSFFV